MHDIAYIQKDDQGEWRNENAFSAFIGFRNRGYEIRSFTSKEMEAGTLPLTKETVVHGSIQAVEAALKQLKIRHNVWETYPHCLRMHMDRAPSEARISFITNAVQTLGFKPCFIKPSTAQKSFTGFVVREYSDLLKITHLQDDDLVWKMPVIEWLSEYRIFMHKGKMIGMRHYKGDSLIFPDTTVVRSIVKKASAMPYVAFSVDVGVAHFPDRPELIRTPTLLVETNDAHSLGAYGIPSSSYSAMIADRWAQLTGIMQYSPVKQA